MSHVHKHASGAAGIAQECHRGDRQSQVDRPFYGAIARRIGRASVLARLAIAQLLEKWDLVGTALGLSDSPWALDFDGMVAKVSSSENLSAVTPRSSGSSRECTVVCHAAVVGFDSQSLTDQDSLAG